MTQQTCSIIMACKHKNDDVDLNPIDRVKRYMSLYCDCPIEFYTNQVMQSIMFEAMCDYMDSCDKPSTFLRILNNQVCDDSLSLAERIALAFVLVQVRENGHFINGFTPELMDNVQREW